MRHLSDLERISILACVTGIALALVWFAGLSLGHPLGDHVAMLITAIGGFELYIFVHEQVRRLRGTGGGRG